MMVGNMWRIFASILVSVVLGNSLRAQTISMIVSNGPVSEKINIAIVAEAYRQVDLDTNKFSDDVLRKVGNIFSTPPFSWYTNDFNVFTITTNSIQRYPISSLATNTAFHSYTASSTGDSEGNNIILIPNSDSDKIRQLASQIPGWSSAKDIIILLVNELAPAGSTISNLVILTADTFKDELVRHELGHALGRLDDEYTNSYAGASFEDKFPNTAATTNSAVSKWGDLISLHPGTVGVFQGAHYTNTWFRSESDCLMRTLSGANALFCEVCSRALTNEILARTTTHTLVLPSNGTVSSNLTAGPYNYGQTVTLTANAPSGFRFAGWTGDITSSSNPLTITVTTNLSITPLFSQISNGGGGGTGGGGGGTGGGSSSGTLFWQSASGSIAAWTMNRGILLESHSLAGGRSIPAGFRIFGIADFDGDGSMDFATQHTDGHISIWFLNSGTERLVRATSSNWQAIGIGDFNSDRHPDILFQANDGRLAVWFMNGASFQSSLLLNKGAPVSPVWRPKGVADLNGDGNADIVWQHSDGRSVIWLMSGTTLGSSTFVRGGLPGPAGWRMTGFGDVDGDGRADILWRSTDGRAAIWFMDSGTLVSSASLYGGKAISTGWTLLGAR